MRGALGGALVALAFAAMSTPPSGASSSSPTDGGKSASSGASAAALDLDAGAHARFAPEVSGEPAAGVMRAGPPAVLPVPRALGADLAAVAAEGEDGDYTDVELELVRDQLLSLTDSLETIEPDVRLNADAIMALDRDNLVLVRSALQEYQLFSDSVEALSLIADDPGVADLAHGLIMRDPREYAGQPARAVIDAARAANATGSLVAPDVFPSPVPNLTPAIQAPPAVTPQPLPDQALVDAVKDDMNPDPAVDADWPSNTAEGLYPPAYPVDERNCQDYGNTQVRSSEVTGAVLRGLKSGVAIAEALFDNLCDLSVEAFGFEENFSRCVPWVILKAALVAIDNVLQRLDRCDAAIDGAEIEAAYENSERILARLKAHEASMRAAMYSSDQHLRDIRDFQERLWIEANLASADDDPNVLLMLPASSCRSLPGDPTRLYPEEDTRERCGLIERVKLIVEETLSMTEESGEGINNAQAEYDAAVAHLTAGDYRAAYGRFRKAYREAVSTRGPR